jgi:hypothetical protein
MLDLLADGALPCIAVTPDGRFRNALRGQRKKRRVAKFLVPRTAFMEAWRTMPGKVVANRGAAVA